MLVLYGGRQQRLKLSRGLPNFPHGIPFPYTFGLGSYLLLAMAVDFAAVFLMISVLLSLLNAAVVCVW